MAVSRRLERSPLDLAEAEAPLIAPDEGPAVEIANPNGQGGIVLICEHASHCIPRSLKGLGLQPTALLSHIAWDPGAAPVARLMAKRLDAPLVLQRFSRLVYDCNRPPEAKSAMPERSEILDIPGNANLVDAERQARIESLYQPFHDAVDQVLDRTAGSGHTPAVVTIHSFTPVFHGKKRAAEIGLLHDVDTSLADAMLGASEDWGDLDVRRNEPYGPEDGVTHTLQRHAIARNLPNVMIEIRNDLIASPQQQAAMAERLATAVERAMSQMVSIERRREGRRAR